jgi:hypothetical protein
MLYILTVDWERLIIGLEVSLALFVALRVLVLRLTSVRRILFFLLVPTIVEPFVISTRSIDLRIAWITSSALQSICGVGVVYALLSTAFSKFPGLLRFFRKVWTMALATGIVTAIWKAAYSPTFLMLSTTFEFDRAISTLVGFAFVSLVGFMLWFPLRITENVQMVSIGAAATFSVRIIIVFTGTLEKAGFRWPFEIGTIVWIACLAYWLLFLSRRGEVVDSEIAQI